MCVKWPSLLIKIRARYVLFYIEDPPPKGGVLFPVYIRVRKPNSGGPGGNTPEEFHTKPRVPQKGGNTHPAF